MVSEFLWHVKRAKYTRFDNHKWPSIQRVPMLRRDAVYISPLFFLFRFHFILCSASKRRCATTRLSEIHSIFFSFRSFLLLHLCTRRVVARVHWILVIAFCLCVEKNKNEYAVMHSTAAKLSGKRTRTIQQPTAVEWSKLMNAVLSLLANERAFFLSLFSASMRVHTLSMSTTFLCEPNARLIVCFVCSFDSQFHSFMWCWLADWLVAAGNLSEWNVGDVNYY